MEFLTTPDLNASVKWPSSSQPTATSRTSSTPVPTSTSRPTIERFPSVQTPPHPNSELTPRPPCTATPYFSHLDRASIKNSFQTLFNPSPSVTSTPALLRQSTVPGLTPFINGMATPGLVPPQAAFLSRQVHEQPQQEPISALSTPYLQAAAKEAVRREFMNMPSYVTTSVPTSFERIVPSSSFPSPQKPMQVIVQTGAAAMSPKHAQQSPQTVPQERRRDSRTTKESTIADKLISQSEASHLMSAVGPQSRISLRHPNPFFLPTQPPGVVIMGQHGVMMPTAPMYPPRMVVFSGSHPSFPPGVVLPSQPAAQRSAPMKSETQAERKARIELEKQELIREFKKKTREAALVRFRQKRRERRFGKLIRYDCRKKLADARPRVKGRFVRIKADEDDISEAAQVVPQR